MSSAAVLTGTLNVKTLSTLSILHKRKINKGQTEPCPMTWCFWFPAVFRQLENWNHIWHKVKAHATLYICSVWTVFTLRLEKHWLSKERQGTAKTVRPRGRCVYVRKYIFSCMLRLVIPAVWSGYAHSHKRQNLQNVMCAQRRLKSVWAG